MTFAKGNRRDNKHYWLTPPELFDQLNKEFEFDFDPCPYPKPDDFDGLETEWGESNYVNPPFGCYKDRNSNKKFGPTAWAKKAINEFKKGKRIIIVYPVDKWILMLLEIGAKVRNLKDIHWHSTEDNLPGLGTGRHVACFILEPKNFKKITNKKLKSAYDLPDIKTNYQQKLFK